MSRVRVNYKSDVPPIGVTFMLGDHEVPVPTTDFVVRFFVEGSPGPSFECIHKGEEYINCEVTSEDTLTCYINNHEFGCGRLCCEFIDLSRNVKYADGVQKTVTPTKLDVVLVDGVGDDLVEITESIAIDIETIIGEIREAMEALDGYANIIAALQAAVATIPNVIDDLETGGHTDALSAEQGKILKEIIDNIGRISIEGITGFTPISSLNELPENPTTEQKRQAYLFENALYVYVGAGGDTLDGKYKSTQLVTLDWNDKAYAPSIYNGLGRTTLKKNMVEGVNVLTAAMIGTANTEYFIQYDYDLGGAEVTLPANASLVFMGGSIKNGTLIGNNTRIQAKKGVCIFDNIIIQGTWDVAEAYSSWFKMHKKGYKIKSVNENGTTIDGVSYATFRVEGYDADSAIGYVAAPEGTPGAFDSEPYKQYDDTASLQNLLDIRAKKTVIEEGIYMVNAARFNNLGYSDNVGLLYEAHNDSDLIINGWLKVIPNDKGGYYALNINDCENVLVTGKGGVQGDLLEHLGSSGETGMCLSVTNTKNLTVGGLTFSYAWGDCVYCSWRRHGRTNLGVNQIFHTFKGVSIIYGGRTGLVYEHGDNVVVDGCYFYGSGRVRGKETKSAVDIEPPYASNTAQRYVLNYEFKNNVFKNMIRGLRLERCGNCSVHDNQFERGNTGIHVQTHYLFGYEISSSTDVGFIKSRMSIYNNSIRDMVRGIYVNIGATPSENMEIYNNLLVDCEDVIYIPGTSGLFNSNVYGNITYGCGTWTFGKLVGCDIYNNNNIGCKMIQQTPGEQGAGRILVMSTSVSENTKFHHNSFTLNYDEPIYGVGGDGKVKYFHGLPVGRGYAITNGVLLDCPEKISFYENNVSDDFIVYYYKGQYDFSDNANFEGGINTVRNESSEVFLVGDTFRSTFYGDEGVVVRGGMMSQSWLENANSLAEGLEVAYGELIKEGLKYRICDKGGVCGATIDSAGDSGTAHFLRGSLPSDPLINPNTGAAITYCKDNIKIHFTKPGRCTSETRPDSFLYAGRKMWETDTNREIVYDGSEWVYNDIYTEE